MNQFQKFCHCKKIRARDGFVGVGSVLRVRQYSSGGGGVGAEVFESTAVHVCRIRTDLPNVNKDYQQIISQTYPRACSGERCSE